jgi:7-carboxy-7-deazaguanine synthase
MDALLEKKRRIVLETNGSVDISRVRKDPDLIISMDIKCPSSGMEDHMVISNMDLLKPTDQLKFVIDDGGDLEYAILLLRHKPVKCEVIFCPVGGMDIEPLAEEVVERQLNVRVMPQLHKMIWGNRRSV